MRRWRPHRMPKNRQKRVSTGRRLPPLRKTCVTRGAACARPVLPAPLRNEYRKQENAGAFSLRLPPFVLALQRPSAAMPPRGRTGTPLANPLGLMRKRTCKEFSHFWPRPRHLQYRGRSAFRGRMPGIFESASAARIHGIGKSWRSSWEFRRRGRAGQQG
jgi:hypothetical protein